MNRIKLNEVVMRDGLQSEATLLSTADKLRLLNTLSALGFAKIEVSSFVSPKAIPQLADAEAVFQAMDRHPATRYTALIPNIKGAQRAAACCVDEFNLVMSVSASHNQANLRMSQADSFDQLSEITGLARQQQIALNVSLSCAFGCPYEGDIPLTTVTSWVERWLAQGVSAITLCDTTGMAYPSQVDLFISHLTQHYPELALTLHFHNTRGLGLANLLEAYRLGMRSFDTSLGGLGGCPFAPGATGNVCTEDVVHALQLEGADCEISLPALLQANTLLKTLVGHPLVSQVGLAGSRLHKPDSTV
ncbi:hydroxymethylglutaryl-CoA lyase [Parvibium lacunae]|uniref:Hydroxymethylglutaryl-CoA lyase n=1 Tax=Parvibium lacunae TaxID=1888893 RepID=A0A368L0U1_9BURK|nr:hydroxymethylglutaryl-CoA lyase [Parvibium lacunae]RCS57156.1 hydroxymethylglutaryl-CoA lyase [Parvibium lacunae]